MSNTTDYPDEYPGPDETVEPFESPALDPLPGPAYPPPPDEPDEPEGDTA